MASQAFYQKLLDNLAPAPLLCSVWRAGLAWRGTARALCEARVGYSTVQYSTGVISTYDVKWV